jgi:hypothetical protein
MFNKIKSFITKRRLTAAIKKTETLMSTYTAGNTVVSLSGSRKKYTEYFKWIETTHPDWTYTVLDADGIIFVSINNNKN